MKTQQHNIERYSNFYPKKLSTNKSRKKYYQEVLSKKFYKKFDKMFSLAKYFFFICGAAVLFYLFAS